MQTKHHETNFRYRRNGIATILLQNFIGHLQGSEQNSKIKAIYLHVLTTNQPAIVFYERHKWVWSFECVGRNEVVDWESHLQVKSSVLIQFRRTSWRKNFFQWNSTVILRIFKIVLNALHKLTSLRLSPSINLFLEINIYVSFSFLLSRTSVSLFTLSCRTTTASKESHGTDSATSATSILATRLTIW